MSRTPSRAAFVGHNTGRYRSLRGLSVSELARRSGVSKATLLALELGEANPTIGTLEAIAATLEVTLAELVTQPSETGSTVVIRQDEGTWHDYPSFRLRALGTLYGPDLVHVVDIEVDAEGQLSEGHERGSVECMLVLDGVVVAGPVDNPIQLEVGDWCRYPAETPHHLRAVSGRARVLGLMCRSEFSVNLLPIERP